MNNHTIRSLITQLRRLGVDYNTIHTVCVRVTDTPLSFVGNLSPHQAHQLHQEFQLWAKQIAQELA
ncbi:MAG: hypothetical protein ACO1RX_19985 [Candidatus Sericytochromatia bacterium]